MRAVRVNRVGGGSVVSVDVALRVEGGAVGVRLVDGGVRVRRVVSGRCVVRVNGAVRVRLVQRDVRLVD